MLIYGSFIWSVAAQVISSGASLLLYIIIARSLGVAGTGLFFQSLMVISIGSVIARLGMDNIITRYISTYFYKKDFKSANDIVLITLKSSLIFLFFLFFFQYFLGIIFDLSFPYVRNKMMLSVPFIVVSSIFSFALRGVGKVVLFTLIQRGLIPIIFILIFFLTIPQANIFTLEKSFNIYIVASFLVSVFSWVMWRRVLSRKFFKKILLSPSQVTWSVLWKSGQHLYVVSLLNLAVFPWTAIFLLGIFSTSEEVGLFGVSMRLATQVSLIFTAIGNVVAHKFAKLHEQGKIKENQDLARRASLITASATTVLSLIMVCLHEELMGLFGEKFIAASNIFYIMLIGQLINSWTGQSGMLLIMTGYEQQVKKALIVSSVVLILCSILLTNLYGANGAAWANIIALIVQKMFLLRYCNKLLKINPLPG